jgi:type I restriction enzyme S subunit
LKYLLKEKLKYGANEEAKDANNNHPRYIRITDFGFDGNLNDESFRSLSPEKAKDYLLSEGDILFARSGATVGKTFQFKGYCGLACYAGYLIKASPDEKKILSDFLYLYTRSSLFEEWKNKIFDKSTIENI